MTIKAIILVLLSTLVMSCTTTGEKQEAAPSAEKVYLYFSYSTIQESSNLITSLTATIQNESITDTIVSFVTSGTATRDTDYSLSATTIIIPAGYKAGSIDFAIIDDSVYEGNETVNANVTLVSGSGDYSYAEASAQTVIYDDENPSAVRLTASKSTVMESEGTVTISANLDSVVSEDIEVIIVSQGSAVIGEDYNIPNEGKIVIPEGSLSASINIEIINDIFYNESLSLSFDIEKVTGGGAVFTSNSGVDVIIANDDANPGIEIAVVEAFVVEGSGIILSAKTSNISDEDIVVQLATSGVAQDGADYFIANNKVITIPSGSLTGTTTLSAIEDSIYELSKVLTVDIESVTGGGAVEAGIQSVDVTILDNEEFPSVSFSTESSVNVESAGQIFIRAITTVASYQDIEIQLTASGFAQEGSDYSISNNKKITIPAGSMVGSIIMTIIDDEVYESEDEKAIFDIETVIGGIENGTQKIEITITDDESGPLVEFETVSSTQAESAGQISIVAKTSTVSSQDIVIQLSTAGTAQDGSDYTVADEKKITILAGSSTGSVVLSIINDEVYEGGSETILMDMTSITGGSEIGEQNITITITDDEVAPLVTLSSSVSQVSESDTEITIQAQINTLSATDTNVFISFGGTATANSDFDATNNKIIITAGQLTGALSIPILNDNEEEGVINETLIISIDSVDGGVESGEQQSDIEIIDNDIPLITLTSSSSILNEDGDPVAEKINLIATSSIVYDTDIIVTLGVSGSATDDVDYAISANKIITIQAGQLSASIELTPINDTEYEGEENITIDIVSVTGRNSAEDGVQSVNIVIADDDLAPTVEFVTTSSTQLESVGTISIEAQIASTSVYDIIIQLVVSGTAEEGTDYTFSNGKKITITAGTLTGSLDLSIIDDQYYEGASEIVTLDVDTVTGAPGATEGGEQKIDITITDDEVPPTVSIAAEANNMYENDASMDITATSTGLVDEDMVLVVSTSGAAVNGTDYVQITSITIPAGQLTATVSFDPIEDNLEEGVEAAKITISEVTGVAGISIQVGNEVNITINEYSMLQSTSFIEGTQALQDQIKNDPRFVNSQLASQGPVVSLEQLNIHKATSFSLNGQDLDGTGQKIHFIDGGCDTSHDIYTGRVVFNLDDGGTGEGQFADSDTSNWHCNHVVGIAVADTDEMIGVATNAEIIISRLFPDAGETDMQSHLDDITTVTGLGAIASNNSWGFPVSYLEAINNAQTNGMTLRQYYALVYDNDGGNRTAASLDAAMDNYESIYKDFQDQGGVVVFSSGNRLNEDITMISAMPEVLPSLKGAWLTVSNVNFTGDAMATAMEDDFEMIGNVCGSAAEYCVSVDGNDLWSAWWVNDSAPVGDESLYANKTGSSMSAPLVSGGIALLSQAFPNHTSKQITDRLLASANNAWFTPDGEVVFGENGNGVKHGYSNTWGHGVPDFYAALSPITTDANPTTNVFVGGSVIDTNNSYSFSESSITTTASFGDALVSSLSNEVGYTYDALSGGFEYDVSKKVNLMNNSINNLSVGAELSSVDKFGTDVKLDWKKSFNQVLLGDNNEGISNKMTLGSSALPIQSFYGSNMDSGANFLDMDTPYLKNNEGGVGFGSVYSTGDARVLFGMTTPVDLNNNGNDIQLGNQNTIATSIEYGSNDEAAITLMTGLSIEKDSLLGSTGSAAFNMDGSKSTTVFAAIKAQAKLGNGFVFTGVATMADTSMTSPSSSLLSGARDVSSNSAALMLRKNNLTKDDEFSMFIKQPNRVNDGSISMRVASLADMDGNLSYTEKDYALATSGRQLDYGISYKKKVSNELSVSMKHQRSRDMNHIDDNAINTSSFVGFKYRDLGVGVTADSDGDTAGLIKYNFKF